MQKSDTEREAFEAWWINRGLGVGTGKKAAWAAYQAGRAALQEQPIPLLAKKHTGMMVDYMGLIGQARSALKHGERSPALAEMLHQLARHIKELGEGWYSGDTSVVDEFLQLYCVEDDARRRIEGES